MSSPAGESRSRAGSFVLTGRMRRLTLLGHIIAALSWLGVDVAIGVLAITGFSSADPAVIAASYIALDVFAVPLLLIFGLSTLGLGLLLAAGSRWGIIRYWWVAAKLVINLVLSSLVLILLQPRLADAAAQSARIDASLRDRLGGIPLDLIFPAFVSGVLLLTAAVLGAFKPWGRTPYGRRQPETPHPAKRH